MNHRVGAPLGDVARSLNALGACLVAPAELNRALGTTPEVWNTFGRHWDDLRPDHYAAELGTRRLRRYGHFCFRTADGVLERLPHGVFVQPEQSNHLYVDRDRLFEPLTESFAADQVLHAVMGLLGGVAQALDDPPRWHVKVTPFRVVAGADVHGDPTPEGLHRDGVTLVSSLMINRRNATGGESSVFDTAGNPVLTATLTEPGTLLVGDDRRTLHRVTPIHPDDPGLPAHRDVLVVTFAS
ncbi:hypothetical protein MMON_18200 [Mycolicibacterium monacense]|uniref:2OG-Fe dioxygenase family protein n=1 Tax=Mycolicibacterium monacense TaxID=85693 RepID=A0AAD1MYD1_MYCMB|nr:hypothetical protein [Mycolicibacterium monacense DSM 44395]BBZ60519.1 hypothetical protein MMON_18200 [Mycolicibacterium monacense]